MPSLPNLPDFDVFQQVRGCRAVRGPVRVAHQVALECREETLDHRVVLAIAGAAHAGDQPVRGEQQLLRAACVLRPAIRMMQGPSRGSAEA